MTICLTSEERAILGRHLTALNRRAHVADGARCYDIAADYIDRHHALFHAIQAALMRDADARQVALIKAALADPLN